MDLVNIQNIFNQFKHNETLVNHVILTSGHINDTYKIETESGNDFVLQSINKTAFLNVEKLIDNKVNTSNYLKNKSKYRVSEYIKTNNDNYLVTDVHSNSWSLSSFIKNTRVFMVPESYEIAEQAGKLLGDFQKSIKGYDVNSLFEIIPDFHNLTSRKQQFVDAFKNVNKEILKKVSKELELLDSFKKDAEYLDELKSSGKLPLRVTHNDAKLSNMLFDKVSLSASALIDFDTIMPGIIHYDIGDATRSICATVDENEVDISKIGFNIDYYKAFMEGYIPVIHSELTNLEKLTIPLSIKYMLYEQSLRFLTDYLNGNMYYKVDYPGHNLVRTKNQLRLLEIINEQFEDIKEITINLFARN